MGKLEGSYLFSKSQESITNENERGFVYKKYTLMNKNTELFDVEMDRGQAETLSNFRTENLHLMPVFLHPQRNMNVSRRDFNEWWSNRRIPMSRGGVKEVLWHLRDNVQHKERIFGLDELAEKCLGLSLSDQYWLRPAATVTWDSVNFFTNEFSEDIGNLLITGDWEGGSLVSPDNTSDGVVRKKWKIIDGKRCLIKGSFGPPWQAQPFREVFASKVAQLLFAPLEGSEFVVSYHLIQEGDYVYSVCPNFITTDTEYVSFNQILQAHKRPNNIAPYEFCKQFYKGYEYVLDLTFILDYIVLNEDRHFGNFGVIRNVNSGEFVKPAPVFDTGSSLFFDSVTINSKRIEAKPFSKDFDTQLKRVNSSLYYDSLSLVQDKYVEIFHEVFEKAFEDEERKVKLLNVIKTQIHKIIE